MAIPIASIPVLTGEAAHRFENKPRRLITSVVLIARSRQKAEVKALEKRFAILRRIFDKVHPCDK